MECSILAKQKFFKLSRFLLVCLRDFKQLGLHLFLEKCDINFVLFRQHFFLRLAELSQKLLVVQGDFFAFFHSFEEA